MVAFEDISDKAVEGQPLDNNIKQDVRRAYLLVEAASGSQYRCLSIFSAAKLGFPISAWKLKQTKS